MNACGSYFEARWLRQKYLHQAIFKAWLVDDVALLVHLVEDFHADVNTREEMNPDNYEANFFMWPGRRCMLHRSPAPFLLHYATIRADISFLRYLLIAPSFDGNVATQSGQTALFLTSSPAVLKILLASPTVYPNHVDGRGFTALHRAAEGGDWGAAYALISCDRVAVNVLTGPLTPDHYTAGVTACDLAATHRHDSIVRLLGRHGGDVVWHGR